MRRTAISIFDIWTFLVGVIDGLEQTLPDCFEVVPSSFEDLAGLGKLVAGGFSSFIEPFGFSVTAIIAAQRERSIVRAGLVVLEPGGVELALSVDVVG